ncbi:porphobilinogen synthase [Magnetofaba australis]|uniref:Delta-aminolevulinic acid dehydratase n=1 Tax=Magnetofaba australis IT-1 TaxID=1434232 RepID=A0A1Y2K8N4_9PROT|nr:porphobilinogen synthase [Magnetofaba australis]OSM07042.1 putative delta-aminolevulinic acid dehydratase [Magnetofaba australis IT-1]
MASLTHRPRRLRRHPASRDMMRETFLSPAHLIYPMFVVEDEARRIPVASMPGVDQVSIDEAVKDAKRAYELGLGGVILFGIPDHKDPAGHDAYDPNGVVQRAIRAIKAEVPELYLIADLCLCEFTDHGHCGIVHPVDTVDNDATLKLLGRIAVTYAQAGIDMVAPSGMMDGMVEAIRHALDSAEHESIPIMAYSVKYASAFYGPFRDAADNAPSFGDRRAYQMDPANRQEALRELELDLEQGADVVMVKPGLPYLDIIRDVRERTHLPVAAYNVSGEYAMIKAAVHNGWLEEERTVLEMLTSFRRAGANMILTYHALDAAQWLRAAGNG